MFFTFKITAKRLFVILAAVIAVILAVDAVITFSGDDRVYCKNDTERVMYLKEQGLLADPEPIWSKQTVLSGSSWEQYAQRLGEKAEDYFGSRVTVYCYELKQGADADCVRMVCCGDEVVGFDLSHSQKLA